MIPEKTDGKTETQKTALDVYNAIAAVGNSQIERNWKDLRRLVDQSPNPSLELIKLLNQPEIPEPYRLRTLFYLWQDMTNPPPSFNLYELGPYGVLNEHGLSFVNKHLTLLANITEEQKNRVKALTVHHKFLLAILETLPDSLRQKGLESLDKFLIIARHLPFREEFNIFSGWKQDLRDVYWTRAKANLQAIPSGSPASEDIIKTFDAYVFLIGTPRKEDYKRMPGEIDDYTRHQVLQVLMTEKERVGLTQPVLPRFYYENWRKDTTNLQPRAKEYFARTEVLNRDFRVFENSYYGDIEETITSLKIVQNWFKKGAPLEQELSQQIKILESYLETKKQKYCQKKLEETQTKQEQAQQHEQKLREFLAGLQPS